MDSAEVRRELRVQIGRQRRRIDRRLRSVEREGRRLLSWRTYLVRYPGWALAVLGAGLTGATSLQRGRWPRRLDWRLFHRMGHLLWNRLTTISTSPVPGTGAPIPPQADVSGDGDLDRGI